MDWHFKAFIQQPRPVRVEGFAEIVGGRNGSWQIGNIYLCKGGVHIADYDERRQIETNLRCSAGSAIGRAYRKSMEGLHHDND